MFCSQHWLNKRARTSSSRSMPPTLKVNGRLVPLGETPLDRQAALALVKRSLWMRRALRNATSTPWEANYAIHRGAWPFRVSAFWQQDLPGMVLRRIETRIPTFDELVAPILQDVAMAKSGLVLFVGPRAPANPPPRRP